MSFLSFIPGQRPRITGNSTGAHGSGACGGRNFDWRFLIRIPECDPRFPEDDYQLYINPVVWVRGEYNLLGIRFSSSGVCFADQLCFGAKIELTFFSRIRHWKWGGYYYDPVEWSDWRESFPVVSREIGEGNIHQDFDVFSVINTPSFVNPPGVVVQPNPINTFGRVEPNDIIEFFIEPQFCTETEGLFTFANINIDSLEILYVVTNLDPRYPL